MLQRIQSLYLGAVCIAMSIFLSVPIWVKSSLDHTFDLRITSYALVSSAGQYIFFPYSLSFLLVFAVIVLAVYAIVRYDNRKLQLHLIFGINLILLILVALVNFLINKSDNGYLVDGIVTYKLSIILPFVACIMSVLARHYIKGDERLVNQDSLR